MTLKYLYVSPAMSIQMSKVETVDGCSTFKNLDNQTYCADKPLGYQLNPYRQKYQTCDVVPIQFRSEYDTNTAKIYDQTDTLVDTLTLSTEASNIETGISYDCFLISQSGTQKRVYFNQTNLPDLEAADTFKITAGQANYLGNYSVVSVGFDTALNKSYLVINKSDAITDPICTVFISDGLAIYDVLQSSIDWSDYGVGTYYVEIEGVDGSDSTKYRSEYISVKTTHALTNLIAYSANVNNWGLYYEDGYANKIRVEGYFFKRNIQGEQEAYLNSDTLVKIDGKSKRSITYETTKLPPWAHEKLNLAFAHNLLSVNGVKYSSSNTYEPEYEGQQGLSNGSVDLIQNDWLGDYKVTAGTDYLFVSPAQSLQFSKRETTNNCSIFKSHANTLYCDDVPLGYNKPVAYQLYQTCDTVKIQFKSSLATNTAKVYDSGDNLIETITLTEVSDYTSGQEFTTTLVDRGSLNSYLILSGNQIPECVGESVVIATVGTYTVQSIQFLASVNKDVIIINRTATAASASVTATIPINDKEYSVYEGEIDFSGYDQGIYYAVIEAVIDMSNSLFFDSELISIKAEHAQTNLVEWSKSEEDFGIDYSSGIVNKMRVPSYLYKRKPKGEQSIFNEADSTQKVGAKLRRSVDFEITSSPLWLHEKLNLALSHNTFTINKVGYQTNELYQPEHIDLFTLSSGSVNLEQQNWIAFLPESAAEEFIPLITSQQYFLLLDNRDYLRLHAEPIVDYVFAMTGTYANSTLACLEGGSAVTIYNHVNYLGLGSRVYATAGDRSSLPANGWYHYTTDDHSYYIQDGLVIDDYECP